MRSQTTIDAVARLIRGITFKPHELVEVGSDGSVVCMRTKNVQDELDESDLIAVPEESAGSSEKRLRSGDILISSANSWELVGKCCYVGELAYPATAGGFISIIRARPEKAHPRFLYHWINSPRQQHAIRHLGRQTTNIANLDVGRFKQLAFPSISLTEQERLSEVLDKADVARRRCRHGRRIVDDLLRSLFFEMFGDPATNPHAYSVEEIDRHLSATRAGTQSGPFGSALKKHEHLDHGIPVWGVDNVQQNEFVNAPKLFITADKFEQLERYRVVPRDVLISRAGTVGRMCIAKPTVDKSIISTNLVRVVLDEETLLPEYFVALFTFAQNRLGTLKANNKNNAFTFLNPGTLRSLRIPIPPMGLQQEFKSLTEQIQGCGDRMKSQERHLDSLFSSLAQRAFRGEI